MLTQIDLMSENAIDLPILGVTPKSSLLIQKVTGLNPPPRSLFIGDYSQDGGIYQGRRVGKRNVVITLNLNPNPALGETVESLRERLHRTFIDPQVEGDYLKMVFRNEAGLEKYLVGYCENFDGEVFDAETTVQISMVCPDPYLRENVDTILTQPTGWVQVPFTYQGSAETGFVVRIYVTAPTTQINLHNNGKLMQLSNPHSLIPLSLGYLVNDIIVINTIRGQRSISLTHQADLTATPTEFAPPAGYITNDVVFYGPGLWRATTDILGGGTSSAQAPYAGSPYWQYLSTPVISHLLASSQWLELHSAANTMRVFGATTDTIVANIKYLKYTSAYWGV